MSRSIDSISRISRQPSQELQQQVAAAFNKDALIHLCSTWDFTKYATKVPLAPTKWSDDRFYWYQDNDSDILAVAHLDSVQWSSVCQVIETAAGPLAVSGALDDRLGAYVILELLPALGITCDILLTTDEERGASTATDFQEDFVDGKQYNWMIEFDRAGTDVVMYQYETPELVRMVEDAGARVGIGSYSDISDLDDLGCIGFNWGVGYEEYHSERSHAFLSDTFRMVARFMNFYEANAQTYLPFDDRLPTAVDDDDDAWVYYNSAGAIEADCGHTIDLEDSSTFTEIEYGKNNTYISCNRCSEKF